MANASPAATYHRLQPGQLLAFRVSPYPGAQGKLKPGAPLFKIGAGVRHIAHRFELSRLGMVLFFQLPPTRVLLQSGMDTVGLLLTHPWVILLVRHCFAVIEPSYLD
jgi:hypothetical protein